MPAQPVFDSSNEMHVQALELIGSYMNCGFVLCGESREYATAYVNEALARYAGYSQAEFIEKYPCYAECILDEDQPYVQSAIDRALQAGDCYDVIYRVRHKDGGAVWIRENGRRIRTPRGEHLLSCIMVDISADMATRHEIETKSNTDPLTGVLNRAAFIEQIGRLFAETPRADRQHVFIMLDVDHFKQINDQFGHGFGDMVLDEVTRKLKDTIRKGDLLGRLGGDEFMLCLRDVKVGTVFERRMEQICAMVSRPLSADVTLSCSFGIAIYPGNGERFETLYRHADLALYTAKRRGRNQIAFYTAEMDEAEAAWPGTPIDAQ